MPSLTSDFSFFSAFGSALRIISVGLPGCQSTLKPGVWHSLPVDADHMWAHADETHARDAFERLARSLRLVADSGLPASSSASSLPESRRANPRKSAPSRAAQGATGRRGSGDGDGSVGDGSVGDGSVGGGTVGSGWCGREGIAIGKRRGVGGRGREIGDMTGASGGDVLPLDRGLLTCRL